MKTPDIMHSQIVQLVEYAELYQRLVDAQTLLDPQGGFINEKEIYEQIDELKKHVVGEMKLHLKNANLNKRVRVMLHNMFVLGDDFPIV